jgi:hypothetical protein
MGPSRASRVSGAPICLRRVLAIGHERFLDERHVCDGTDRQRDPAVVDHRGNAFGTGSTSGRNRARNAIVAPVTMRLARARPVRRDPARIAAAADRSRCVPTSGAPAGFNAASTRLASEKTSPTSGRRRHSRSIASSLSGRHYVVLIAECDEIAGRRRQWRRRSCASIRGGSCSVRT